MNTPRDTQLDERLQRLFRDLDAAPDFDARLMERLRAESKTDAHERMIRTRKQERERHERALPELQSQCRSTLRRLTFDTVGIACLMIVAIAAVWPHVGPQIMDGLRQYGPQIAMLLGVLVAAVPLVGMWAEEHRKPTHF
jgi:hypothetical protein